jgi:DNA-binding NarL/FixJ family response regulator
MNKENPPTYTIVLADPHIIIRQGLKRIIQSTDGLKVLGETGDGYELLKLIKEKRPHLAIIDISLSSLRGVEATQEIKIIDPGIKVLILTMYKSENYISQAFSVGVDGYLLKEDAETELIKAIQTLQKGDIYISPLLSTQLRNLLTEKHIEFQTESSLTLRESEILQLIAHGKSNTEIGDLLSISIKTIESHRKHIMRKLNLKNTVELVKFAIKNGYIAINGAVLSKKLINNNERFVREFKTRKTIDDIRPFILRSIEFSPEHHEAGLTILSYFGKIVRQKYAGMKVKVNIEQEDLTVRMIIKTDRGNIDKIEKTIEEYGLVIKGEMPITEFISDPYQVADLKQQLRIAHLQLENQKELLSITKDMHEKRIFNLEEEVIHLRSCIANGLKLRDNKDIILQSAIKLIENKLTKDINQQDFLELKEALHNIQQRNQPSFVRIIDKINLLFIQGSISGVAGNALYDFIKTISKAM